MPGGLPREAHSVEAIPDADTVTRAEAARIIAVHIATVDRLIRAASSAANVTSVLLLGTTGVWVTTLRTGFSTGCGLARGLAPRRWRARGSDWADPASHRDAATPDPAKFKCAVPDRFGCGSSLGGVPVCWHGGLQGDPPHPGFLDT